MKIDGDNPTPKYLQLKDIITQHFKDARYQPGQKIPTENELMSQFDVSRSTVRQTLAELVSEGVIYKRQGSGTFFAGKAQSVEKQTYLIGVLTPRITYYIYPQMIQGIDEVAQKRGYNIVLSNASASAEKELACLEQLLDKDIDGLLFEPSGGYDIMQDSPIFATLQKLTIPLVIMDWEIDQLDASYVSIDDELGGFLATEYLAKAGHSRIACVYPKDKIPAMQRYRGYRKALDAAGISYDRRLDKSMTTLVWDEPGYIEGVVRELLGLGDEARPTGMFFFNDDAALHAYNAIRAADLTIPGDISVIGFDNSELGLRADVPLTSVEHSKYHIGKWAAEILFEEIESQENLPVRQVMVRPQITVRDSVKMFNT